MFNDLRTDIDNEIKCRFREAKALAETIDA
jgi:hypothetical protein